MRNTPVALDVLATDPVVETVAPVAELVATVPETVPTVPMLAADTPIGPTVISAHVANTTGTQSQYHQTV